MIERYVRRAEIRTADGKLALDVHPHLFRHHLGTSMVNENIPLTVIAEVLDHGSMEMTARYARLHDETIKRAVKRWHERVNIRGERIALPVDGPLEEAAWMKERIARAKQALPERVLRAAAGADLPAPERVPDLRELPHRRLVPRRARAAAGRDPPAAREGAHEQGNVRLIEMLERDEQSLTRILDGLDQIEADHADDGDVELDLRDLADRDEPEGA